jgi:hypothetical protein
MARILPLRMVADHERLCNQHPTGCLLELSRLFGRDGDGLLAQDMLAGGSSR